MEGSSTFFVGRLTRSNDTGTNLRPSRGRSAGPDFSPMRNRGKNRQRRGLPPPCGIHPAGTGWSVRRSIFSPWPGEVTWMAWRSMGGIYFSAGVSIYRQGFTLVSRCSQRSGARFPAARTPHTGVRPWKQRHSLTEKEMLSIDLPGHLCDPTGARAGHRIDAVPAPYPKGGP